MEFFKLMKERHSVRSFQKKEIPEEKVKKILQAINSAPSAGNLQAFEVVLVESQEKKDALAKAALGQTSIEEAGIVLVFFANYKRSSVKYGERGEKLYSLQDATIATAYAQLAAQALGLSSCWIGAFEEKDVSKTVNAPQSLVPVAILPIGFAEEKPFVTERRSLKELVKEENF
jgi:nitroreductase